MTRANSNIAQVARGKWSRNTSFWHSLNNTDSRKGFDVEAIVRDIIPDRILGQDFLVRHTSNTTMEQPYTQDKYYLLHWQEDKL